MPVSGGEAVSGYKVYRDDGSGSGQPPDILAATVDSATNTATVSNLQLQTTYQVAVVATSLVGNSDLSAVISATTLNNGGGGGSGNG